MNLILIYVLSCDSRNSVELMYSPRYIICYIWYIYQVKVKWIINMDQPLSQSSKWPFWRFRTFSQPILNYLFCRYPSKLEREYIQHHPPTGQRIVTHVNSRQFNSVTDSRKGGLLCFFFANLQSQLNETFNPFYRSRILLD